LNPDDMIVRKRIDLLHRLYPTSDRSDLPQK
jgi:hypothetical protein